ncbi:MAG: acyl-[Lachnospiraceae bacterium]|nr:acyl-[acyl-carrier-protein] thioesterase [Lachnospiraceae bacterium]
MYSFNSRVRFSETDTNRKLSITGVMNYLQDCSIFQSEDAGLGFAHVQETKKSWLLSAWNVEVVRRPDVAEEITIATWPYDFKGIYGLRNFAILDKDG